MIFVFATTNNLKVYRLLIYGGGESIWSSIEKEYVCRFRNTFSIFAFSLLFIYYKVIFNIDISL